MAKDGAQCLARLQSADASSAPIRQELVNLRHGQAANGEMSARQPTDQVIEQPALLPDCAGRVSLPAQILLKATGKGRDRNRRRSRAVRPDGYAIGACTALSVCRMILDS